MDKWNIFPTVYSINTLPWLNDLSHKAGFPITLGNVPNEEVKKLADYGFDAVWLMGVWKRSIEGRDHCLEKKHITNWFKAALPDYLPEDVVGSPYSILKYEVDERLGGNQEFKQFREQLRLFGLRLILDFVPNHLAIDHPWLAEHPDIFVQGSQKDKEDKSGEYFYYGEGDQRRVFANGRPPYYEGWQDTAQLDYRNPKTREIMTSVLLDIAENCDGVRCDMAMLVTNELFRKTWGGSFDPPEVEFWPTAIGEVKSRHANFLMIAEVYYYLEYLLQQQGFDYTYDKVLYDRLLGDNLDSLRAHLKADFGFQSHLARFIENHDEERIVSILGVERSLAVATLALTLPGLRLINQGQLEGLRWKQCIQLRRSYKENPVPDIERFYQKLLGSLHQPVFHNGTWRLLPTYEAWPENLTYRNMIAHQSIYGSERRLVVVNLSSYPAQCYLRPEMPGLEGRAWLFKDLLGPERYTRDGDELLEKGLYLDLPPYGHQIYDFQPAGLECKGTSYEHNGGIYSIAWSPDGKIIASAGQDKFVWLWNITDDVKRKLADHPHPKTVSSLAWSPDGQVIATGCDDHNIYLWDSDSGVMKDCLRGHYNHILSLAWSKNGELLASGSIDRLLYLWNKEDRRNPYLLGRHNDAINSLVWSPIESHILASGSGDRLIRLWDTRSCQQIGEMKGQDWVSEITWSPDGKMIAASTGGGTIDIYNASTNKLITILEGHKHRVLGVNFSFDGKFLASKSADGTVRLWRTDLFEEVVYLEKHSIYMSGVAFHPRLNIFAIQDDKDNSLELCDIDAESLITSSISSSSVIYGNAKVVLLGETGVGKTSLGHVLRGGQFVPEMSTHGRHVWLFDKTKNEDALGRTEIREIYLWDFAGQPGYRLIHQLYLDDVDVALIVFDARNETNPFAGIRYWQRALKLAERMQRRSGVPIRKILVEARVDRGTVGLNGEQINRLISEMGSIDYYKTSARENWQIKELIGGIHKAIDWESMPKVQSRKLFQEIKSFLVQKKIESNWILTTFDDLYTSFIIEKNEQKDLYEVFEHCIDRVESQGLIRRLSFGDLLLLQPELLESYASAIIMASKEESHGMGCIFEENVKSGDFYIPAEIKILNKNQERHLLIATIEDLLYHEIALREELGSETLLIFPSQFTRENPELPNPEIVAVKYRFEGPIKNIYTTLVVRLTHSETFCKPELWKNAVIFTSTLGEGKFGLWLEDLEEGEGKGELSLFFKDGAQQELCVQFEEYVKKHLQNKALVETIKQTRTLYCSSCGTNISEQLYLAKIKRGFKTMKCPVCEEVEFDLSVLNERLVILPKIIEEMESRADEQRDREISKSIMNGKIETKDFDVFLAYNSKDKPQQVYAICHALRQRAVNPWIDIEGIPPGDWFTEVIQKTIHRVKSAAIILGPKGTGDWQKMELYTFIQQCLESKIPVIPVLLPGVEDIPKDLLFLKLYRWVKFTKDVDEDNDALDMLVWGITGEKPIGGPIPQYS
jgi:WD40 repeat protein